MNVKGVYISQIIGMSLYMFQAAGFIKIEKSSDYAKSRKTTISRTMIPGRDEKSHFFYEKYSACIETIIETQII